MCSFCENEVQKGTGVMYAKKDGTLYYFCSSKCKKNQLGLGREGRKKKWTMAYRNYLGRTAAKAAKDKKAGEKPKEAPKKEAPKAKK